jgi:hypothetical protein
MQKLLIRYTLDAMHCEMNLAKNFLKTSVGMKDTVKVGRDLQWKNIRKYLWLARNPRRGRKMLKLAAPYVLNDDEFKVFASTIKNLKTPIGHSSNLGKHIRSKKFGGGDGYCVSVERGAGSEEWGFLILMFKISDNHGEGDLLPWS